MEKNGNEQMDINIASLFISKEEVNLSNIKEEVQILNSTPLKAEQKFASFLTRATRELKTQILEMKALNWKNLEMFVENYKPELTDVEFINLITQDRQPNEDPIEFCNLLKENLKRWKLNEQLLIRIAISAVFPGKRDSQINIGKAINWADLLYLIGKEETRLKSKTYKNNKSNKFNNNSSNNNNYKKVNTKE